MSATPPDQGPRSTLQRILPLVLIGVSMLLVFQLFPQFFGMPGAQPAPTPVDALSTPAPTPAPEIDTSTRTAVWNQLLVAPLEAGLRFLANDLALGAGSAIILFTILVRAVLLPLSIMQIRSQKAMMRLQPDLKALQKKHGKDKEKLSVDTMALYKEHGVNPAAGCFPIVLQMPVLFGLYAALNNLGTQNLPENAAFLEPWMWVAGLNKPDVFILGGITLPFVLPVLAAVTQWIQQRMMAQPTEDPQQKMQNQMFQFMPLMMLWFGLSFSSGLALYWVVQNVIGIVQQYFSTGLGSLASVISLLPGRRPAPEVVITRRGDSGTRGNGGSTRQEREDRNGPRDVTRDPKRAGQGRRSSGKR